MAHSTLPGSMVVLTDEAVTTCQALEALRQMAGLDIMAALDAISTIMPGNPK